MRTSYFRYYLAHKKRKDTKFSCDAIFGSVQK
jgi:hypothetical protein